MNALFIENKYRIRVQNKTAIRLRKYQNGAYCGVVPRNATADIVIDRNSAWVSLPSYENAGLSLKHLQEYWDDLALQIDAYRIGSSWTEVQQWSDVEFLTCS